MGHGGQCESKVIKKRVPELAGKRLFALGAVVLHYPISMRLCTVVYRPLSTLHTFISTYNSMWYYHPSNLTNVKYIMGFAGHFSLGGLKNEEEFRWNPRTQRRHDEDALVFGFFSPDFFFFSPSFTERPSKDCSSSIIRTICFDVVYCGGVILTFLGKE